MLSDNSSNTPFIFLFILESGICCYVCIDNLQAMLPSRKGENKEFWERKNKLERVEGRYTYVVLCLFTKGKDLK